MVKPDTSAILAAVAARIEGNRARASARRIAALSPLDQNIAHAIISAAYAALEREVAARERVEREA